MATSINKRTAFNKYLAGCEYYGIEAEYTYEEQTAKQFVGHTNALWRRMKAQQANTVVNSVAKNTEQARNYVTRKAGESRKSVIERAKALKAKVPFTVSIKWN